MVRKGKEKHRLAGPQMQTRGTRDPHCCVDSRLLRSALNALSRDLCPQELERQLWARGEDPREFCRLHRDLITISFTCCASGTSGGVIGWFPSWGGRWDLPKCDAGSSRGCSSLEPGREGASTLGSPAESTCSRNSRKPSVEFWQEKLPDLQKERRQMRQQSQTNPIELTRFVSIR